MKKLLFLLFLSVPWLAGAQSASFWASADTVCSDSCVTFINTSSGSIDSVQWYATGNLISFPHADTINVCFPASGRDTVILSVYRGGSIDSAQAIINVKHAPHPTIDPGCGCVHGAYESYQWYDCGVLIPGATDSVNVRSGLCECWWVLVDSGGCWGSSDTMCILSVYSVGKADFTTVAPNPATSMLLITAPTIITTLSITNLIGQTISSHEYHAETVQVDVADLPPGVYFVKINGTEVRKFVKQ